MEEQRKKIEKAQQFCNYLQNHGVQYEWCIKHKEVSSCVESFHYYERFHYYLGEEYSICKNLLVKERKGNERFFLIIVDASKQVDLAALRPLLFAQKLTFVDAATMQEVLKTTPGNVSLFNMIYDQQQQIEPIIDASLLSKKFLAFHPLYNGMSLFIKPPQMFHFLTAIHRMAQVIHIPEKKSSHTITNSESVKRFVK